MFLPLHPFTPATATTLFSWVKKYLLNENDQLVSDGDVVEVGRGLQILKMPV